MAKFKPSFLENIGADLVTVQIGDGDTRQFFPVHKDLLTACSPYFKAAFDGKFKEATDKAIPIPDVTPTQFRLFLDWLYFRRLPERLPYMFGFAKCINCSHSGSTCEVRRQMAGLIGSRTLGEAAMPFEGFPPLSDETDQQLEHLITTGPWYQEMLYVFADRCDVPALRQNLIDELWKNKCPFFGAVIYVLRHLPIKSPLSRLVLDDTLHLYDIETVRVDQKCGTEVLLRQKLPLELVWGLFYRNMNKDTGTKPIFAYHEHEQDEETIKRCQEEMAKNKK